MTADPIQRTVLTAARQAGVLLLDRYQRQAFTTDAKGVDDLVTSADHEAEALILGCIRAQFPGHAVLTEESGLYGGAEFTWYVDPLDGTLNFANHLPCWCTSVAVADSAGLYGAAIVDPLHGENYAAVRAGGASLNEQPMRVRQLSVDQALIATNVGSNAERRAAALPALIVMAPLVRRVRVQGSIALTLAYVAAGRLDAAIQLSVSPWDIMAGALLVQEAGGIVTDSTGVPLGASTTSVLAAATPALHAALLAAIIHSLG